MTQPVDIYDRLFRFACRTIAFCRTLSRTDVASVVLARQLVASATSAGANSEEAKAAGSRRDFRARFRIVLKESRESKYWLKVAVACGMGNQPEAAWLQNEADELVAILTTILKRTEPHSHS